MREQLDKNTDDYTTEILGCWKPVEMHYEVKSNYPAIDSMVLNDRKKSAGEKMGKRHIINIAKGTISQNDENGVDENPTTYYLKGDSLFMESYVRRDKSKAKIRIVNDSLYLDLNILREFSYFVDNMEWHYKVVPPEDLKLEKMTRHVVLVRVPDCKM